jgi:hypothetical protein
LFLVLLDLLRREGVPGATVLAALSQPSGPSVEPAAP